MANPFFSGRIPQDLLNKIEQHCKDTGESKTDILVKALCKYLDFPLEETKKNQNSEIKEEQFYELESRVKALEETIKKLVEDKTVKKTEEETNLNIKTNSSGNEIYENITTNNLYKLTNIPRRTINKFIEQSVETMKAKGEQIVPNNFFEEPIEIIHKETILIKEYPYKIFYKGENAKGQPIWNLIPDDNASYQTVIKEVIT